MLSNYYKLLAESLTEPEAGLVIKGLSGPVTTKPAILSKLATMELATINADRFSLTALGERLATFLLSAIEIAADEEVNDHSTRWHIQYEIVQPTLSRQPQIFREALSVIEAIEARAVSFGHAVMRGRYPTASRIRAVSRTPYELPRDMNAVEFLNPSTSSG